MKEFIYPVNIVESDSAQNLQSLLQKKPLQIGLTETDTAHFDEGGHIILDFGLEMNGGIRILTFAAELCPIRIRFGESLTECCSEVGGEKNATNDHSLRDFTEKLPAWSDMTFGQTGFRFVRIDFFGKAEIKSIVAENNILKKTPIYIYDGPDEEIKKIFNVAKRTVDLCGAGDFLWDGVKRDRLVWIGDIHPEMMALTTLYGRLPLIERSLDFVKAQTPLPGWMNTYPMYSMWWIIILADYFEKTGTSAFAKKQLPYLGGLIAQISACVDQNGVMDFPLCFVDWPTVGSVDEIPGARAICIISVKKAIQLLSAFEKDTKEAEDLLERLLKVEIKLQKSKQVTGLKFFATGLDETDRARLVKDGAHGMSTFMSYYILKAVASFDKPAAIAMMKEYYGAMLKKGATTFWEDFDLNWAENSCRIDCFPAEGEKDIHGDFGAFCYKGFRHSLCHGWSAGVLQFIKEECE